PPHPHSFPTRRSSDLEDRRGHSHLTVARSHDGVSNWQIDSKPSFAPDTTNFSEELWGVEDPRLTWVAERDEWIIAYTAFSPSGPDRKSTRLNSSHVAI